MRNIYIYGASGHAKVIAEIAELNGFHILGAIDKNVLLKILLNKYPVVMRLDELSVASSKMIIAVGNNTHRRRIAEGELAGYHFAKLIHTKACISSYSDIGEGTVIMAGAIINAGCKIGKHCIINTNATIDHDCVLEDYVHISPNAALAGNVIVGAGTHIGIGASIIQGINIGKNCIIGAGSVIIKDIPDDCTVVGNPGRILKSL